MNIFGVQASPGRDFKYWSRFKASVAEINEFVRPRVLRRYQAGLLSGKGFTIVSPASGNRIPVTRSTMVGKRIAYLVQENVRSWLLTGNLREGYPLTEMISEADGYCRPVTDKIAAGVEFPPDQIRILQVSPAAMLPAHVLPQPVLQIGHVNFAHHIWNELAALDEWLKHASSESVARLSIISTAEPLGRLEEIFPSLAGAAIHRMNGEASKGYLARAGLIVRAGSCLVSESIRQRILGLAESRANLAQIGACLALFDASWPRIWVSVREHTRTAENLEEFLTIVMLKILRHYPQAAIILDAFSFPIEFMDDDRTISKREIYTTAAEGAGRIIAKLTLRIESELGENAARRICSANGETLYEAIHLGRYCDFYVCHAGTLQHKIGWFHRLPGLIHMPVSPDPRPSWHPAQLAKHHIPLVQRLTARQSWHALQVEGGVIPDRLPEDLVVITTPGARAGERNFNYRIADVESAAEYVLASMRNVLVAPRL